MLLSPSAGGREPPRCALQLELAGSCGYGQRRKSKGHSLMAGEWSIIPGARDLQNSMPREDEVLLAMRKGGVRHLSHTADVGS